MSPIGEFSLTPENHARGEAWSRLRRGSTEVARVEGVVLEAQYRCRAGDLVVTSDGNPFEELLHFYLVGDGDTIVDDVSLGRAYNAGMFRDPAVVPGADALEFAFFSDERWRLSIMDPPRRAALVRLFSSVKRSRRWLAPAYLDLRRTR